jgi:RND superfamily putative drug exporter
MPAADTQAVLDAVAAASGDGLTLAAGGEVVAATEAPAIGSEVIGIAAAAIILLLVFGTVVAAGLPILVAVAGLAVSSLLTVLVAAALPVPDWSTSLATMMGLGVGIDYALLMVTRFREWRSHGLDVEDATVATLDTAGRSVVLAGTTVVVSMLGLAGMGLSFMRGAALVTIVAVLVVMAAAVTLFPALLGYLGHRIDRLRLPLPRRSAQGARGASAARVTTAGGWLRWSRLVQQHRWLAALAGTAIMVGLAAPFLGVQFGTPDAGNNPLGTSTRTSYDMIEQDFGPGTNGPLLVVLTGPTPASVSQVTGVLAGTPGVRSASPVALASSGASALVTVVPDTGPQDPRTAALVRDLRRALPAATAATGTTVHIGGTTAATLDSDANIARRIPLLLGEVVGLSLLLLLVAFRSIAIALKAAVLNLMSVAAAYGVVAYVLQGGWAGQLIGIDDPTPLPAFVPVLMFAVLFSLSADYEIFLLSRMRDTHKRTGDTGAAIVAGLAGTARVITAAAAIMVAVFAAFVPSTDVGIKVIGVGMAAAILIDATVVRLLLVPAVMHLLGEKNWWLPAWLDSRLPHLAVEGHEDAYLLAATAPVASRELAGVG